MVSAPKLKASVIGSKLLRPFLWISALVFLTISVALVLYLRSISSFATAVGGQAIITAFSASILIVVVILFTGYQATKNMTAPIEKLASLSQEIREGNFQVRANIHTGDELETLGAAFDRAVEELEKTEKNRMQFEKSKTEFLSMISHELRSPMTTMKAQLQMLNKGYFGDMNAKQRESIHLVVRNTERLDNIIVDLLEVSRIEAARLKFTFVRTNLTTHIRRLAKDLEGITTTRNIKLILNMGQLPIIEVDPDRVLQVIRNLLNNAIKFSHDNSKIIISANVSGDTILISVQDFGVGIPAEKQRNIFEPFFQVEETFSREHGGTGLGLAICRGIVESQNGKIWFTSTFGKGTVFFFTVPLRPVKEVQPIRLLFSSTQYRRQQLSELFGEMLGPVGLLELADFKDTFTYENLCAYIASITQQGIITEKAAALFVSRLDTIFLKNETREVKRP